MRKILSKKEIIGLPDLKIAEDKICGDYQIGKHTNMSHKTVQHLTTTCVLELLHMNLIGPMKV